MLNYRRVSLVLSSSSCFTQAPFKDGPTGQLQSGIQLATQPWFIIPKGNLFNKHFCVKKNVGFVQEIKTRLLGISIYVYLICLYISIYIVWICLICYKSHGSKDAILDRAFALEKTSRSAKTLMNPSINGITVYQRWWNHEITRFSPRVLDTTPLKNLHIIIKSHKMPQHPITLWLWHCQFAMVFR